MTRDHNWSDTYTFKAACIHRPRSVDEVRRIVGGATHVRAIGARHSFNGVADSPGELIDLRDLEMPVEIDAAGQTARVPAGIDYGSLAARLHAQGWALHNMGSLPHISVAGATATGTHGSGDKNGNLSSAVAGLELVTASGDLVTLRRGDPDFDAVVVGLGAFGVITAVTLDIQPTFMLRQDAFADLPWSTALAKIDDIMGAAYSVSLMTKWAGDAVNRLWLKTHVTDAGPLEVTAAHLGAVGTPHATAGPSLDMATQLTPFGSAGPWSERICHFNPGVDPGPLAQIQSEYMVPRANARAALEAIRGMADRIDDLLIMTEIRTMRGDQLWLSPSYGHDTIALHFTWRREPEPVDAITREVEDKLMPLGGRPHWGKLMHATAAALAPLYPRLPDFCALADRYDPAGKFRNDFLRRHVFG